MGTAVELIVLGSGGSAGTPAITNWWGACDPAEPRNRRTRPSIALKTAETLLIVDTGPDFREQTNRENLGCPKAVLFTHEHADHVNGIDELRTLQRLFKTKFTVYGRPECLGVLEERFRHMFVSSEDGFYPSVCDVEPVIGGQDIVIGNLPISLIDQEHGSLTSLGLRIGDVAYCTDFKRLDERAVECLQGVRCWIADAAGYHSDTNPVHANLNELYALNERIGAEEVWLTHLPPTMDYQTLLDELPDGFAPLHDGQRFSFSV